jgi:hypothetical protein
MLPQGGALLQSGPYNPTNPTADKKDESNGRQERQYSRHPIFIFINLVLVWDATMLVQTTFEAAHHHTTIMHRSHALPTHSTTTHRLHRKQRTTAELQHAWFDDLLDKEPRQKIGTKDTQPTRNQDARCKPSSYFGYGRTRQSAFTRLQQLC